MYLFSIFEILDIFLESAASPDGALRVATLASRSRGVASLVSLGKLLLDKFLLSDISRDVRAGGLDWILTLGC